MDDGFDFRNPDYAAVFRRRIAALERIRANPGCLPDLKAFYRLNPAQFIDDWGTTFDPRNAEIGIPTRLPFILFPRQREWIDFIMARWRAREDGLTEKSRDMGISWLAVSLSATLCLHYQGIVIGFGSKTEDEVDSSANPNTLFWKARTFLEGLPVEFRGGYERKRHTSHMQITFPEAGSAMVGDAGDDIGRGARTSLYFLDESSAVARPALVDRALSQTTNCRQDMSTPRGRANGFAIRRFSGKIPVFTFHWRQDPRKDEAWYLKQGDRLDPVTLAQEVDLDYYASVEGVLIPSAWVQAAVDAHITLKVEPTGHRLASLDVADQGKDKNALCVGQGVWIEDVQQWSGKGSDLFYTAQKAADECDARGIPRLRYDADGMGAGIRAAMRVINEQRASQSRPRILDEPFRGSEAVANPEWQDVPGRKNKDYFLNRKAQAWWQMRNAFQITYRAVREGAAFDPDTIISLNGKMPELAALMGELSQPTWAENGVGKLLVNKTPDGVASPNLADAVMIQFSRTKKPLMRFTAEDVAMAGRPMR